jgi:hypothetical protein
MPDDLATEIKVIAAQERTTLKELIGELLRAGIRSRQQQARPMPLPPVYDAPIRLSRPLLSRIRKEGR